MALLGLCAASACIDYEKSPEQSLKQHLEKWDERRPTQYVVEVCRTGFRHGCERLAVDGDTVTAAETLTHSADGDWQPVREGAQEEPIARLFDAAHAPEDCILKELRFDDDLGFLREYYLDCDEEGFGEEVVCFEPDTQDLSLCDENW